MRNTMSELLSRFELQQKDRLTISNSISLSKILDGKENVQNICKKYGKIEKIVCFVQSCCCWWHLVRFLQSEIFSSDTLSGWQALVLFWCKFQYQQKMLKIVFFYTFGVSLTHIPPCSLSTVLTSKSNADERRLHLTGTPPIVTESRQLISEPFQMMTNQKV